jgi:hypothetical protein
VTDRELLEAARATVLRLDQEHAAWRDRVAEEAGKDKWRIAELEAQLREVRRAWREQQAAWQFQLDLLTQQRNDVWAERDLIKRQYAELLVAGQAERDKRRAAQEEK